MSTVSGSDGLRFFAVSSKYSPFVSVSGVAAEIDAMKAPITLSKIGTYAFLSALFVLVYSMMGHLIETLHSPKTIKHSLVLYVLHLSMSVVIHLYVNRRKKSSTPSEAEH